MKNILIALGLSAIATVAVADVATGGRPWVRIFSDRDVDVVKVCDRGRAVYVATGGYYPGSNATTTALAIVENAPECSFGAGQ